MQSNDLLTLDAARTLLRPSGSSVFACAEDQRLWSRRWTPALRHLFPGSVLDDLWDSVLMRSYGSYSGSRPDSRYRMVARASRMRLDTIELRQSTLTTHVNHKIWEDTPYISFTNCASSLQELADRRTEKADQWIVVVDPRTRIELGLPVLNCSDEMKAYNIPSPYIRNYWSNHFFCLWEVSPAEVVGVWRWDDLRNETNWYKTVVIPAVERHRMERNENRAQSAIPRQDILNDSICPDPGRISDGDGSFCDDQEDTYAIFSDRSDHISDNDDLNDSEDSYERVCDENWTGEMMKMYEDLRLE